MKKLLTLLVACALILTFSACSGGTVASTGNTPTTTVAGTATDGPDATVDTDESEDIEYVPVSVAYDDDDLDSDWDSAGASFITFNDDVVNLDGNNAIVDGSTVTITSAGTYIISGTTSDGQIIVNTRVTGTVRLVLNDADITCATSAPIYIMNAEKTVITLADGTSNRVADGNNYILEDADSDEPNAAIFSKNDLTINGGGSLSVEANYNNGIQSKDDLKITGGSITVDAANNAIKGKDSVVVKDGNIVIEAGGDGIQSSNGGDADKGFVAIEGGTIDIIAGEDGIQAETNVLVSGGDITITTGGGSVNSSTGDNWGEWGPGNRQDISVVAAEEDTGSAKGIKADIDVTITGGTINIDSSDDALHSNGSITINGGDIDLASGDDGMHADATLDINGGEIDITKSYEGIESAVITINDGNIHVVASDDGINVSGGNDGSSINGRPGQNEFQSSGNDYLYINGGYLYVDAAGDGIDVNGLAYMTDGEVIVNGPTNDGNGALDYLGTFKVTGGLLVAAGSSGMAQAPSTDSTQYAVMVNFDTAQAAGTLFHLETEDGEEILTFAPTKQYQSLVFCSPELENGETYLVYTGGSTSGTASDGLYTGGTYTPGTQVTSLTISGIVTTYGSAGMMGGGMMPGGGGGRPR